MPFLRQEGRLLRARRAYTRMQNVTHWFLVGYILGCRWWYMRVVRVVSLVGCKDYLSSHELSSLTYITPNESWNALCSLYAEGPLWARNVRKKALLTLWALWEKNVPPRVSNILFLTEEHRWTEHTKGHRDMKSTDITERYSQHPLYRGISVITPLPFGEGKGEGPLLALNPVCYVHLCSSVREKEVLPE